MQKYNIIIVGGGLSGVAAAIAAARQGLKALIIEKSGSLGGAVTNNLIFPFMPYWTQNAEGEKEFLSRGIFEEIVTRLKKLDPQATITRFNSEILKLLLDEMVIENGIDVLFHSSVFDVKRENRVINSVSVISGAQELELSADFFVDATGDGNLFALAGCDFQLGRTVDGYCQPMTTCFRVCGADAEQFHKERAQLNEVYKKYHDEGKFINPREDILVFTNYGGGILHFNTTRIIKHNPTDAFDISRAEITARQQVYEIFNFLKEHTASMKNSFIVSIANEIGVRESRKLKGVHILTQDEIKNTVSFEDCIALGNYDIDIHDPVGGGTSHYFFKNGEYYQIPYRSLLPKEFDNLLVAGRCISATHEAQASIRIMPICTCLGEAVGTAIAEAYLTDENLHTVDINAVRQRLIENGAAV